MTIACAVACIRTPLSCFLLVGLGASGILFTLFLLAPGWLQ
jgi:hypothetical protein